MSYSVLINGVPYAPCLTKKGLRQGEPLSSFLFVAGMEYLSKCMNTLHHNAQFHYHPKCKRSKIPHLMFADDLLLFCKLDIESI